jgi:hypothetical protein
VKEVVPLQEEKAASEVTEIILHQKEKAVLEAKEAALPQEEKEVFQTDLGVLTALETLQDQESQEEVNFFR